MVTPETIELLEERYGQLTLLTGFDKALIGVCHIATNLPVAAYDVNKCIEILMDRDEMEYEDARDYFEYNVQNLYIGTQTPALITTYDK